MSMTAACDIFCRGDVLHGKNRLCNHCSRVRSHDVDAEQATSSGIGQDLDEPLGVAITTSAAVRGEWELAHLVGYGRGLKLLLRLADGGDFRPSVETAGIAS
jgi:hypothetical protein